MKVLSLFDGISCARVALERAGIPVDAYFASEIDKYAIQVSKKNYPDIIHLGDIKQLNTSCIGDIDLLIGGSPCQDLSIAKRDRKGLDGDKSSLFWEYVAKLKTIKPTYFILENVASMPKEAKQVITDILGVEPIMIDAALVSGQRRKRLFWTNIQGVTQPKDRGILLKDILIDATTEKEKSYCIDACSYKGASYEQYKQKGERQLVLGNGGVYLINPKMLDFKKNYEKSTTLTSTMYKEPPKIVYEIENVMRKLHPIECERLQGLPDNYTEGISNTQRYKCLGNAFNVDVVTHILSFIKKE